MLVEKFPRLSIALSAVAMLVSACSDTHEEAWKHKGDMALAISWQSAFCETRSRLPECRSQKPGRFDTNHFSLHGLWPQPRSNVYCGVSESTRLLDQSRQWKKLEGLGLDDQVQTRLWKLMPGTRSFLHRHEWVKHGTCYSTSPDIYYQDSIRLMDDINGSLVRELFAKSIGKALTVSQIRTAFDRSFGPGSGKRVKVSCKRDGRRTLITELIINLSGELTATANLQDLISAGAVSGEGCRRGIIDRVGLQ